MDSAEQGRECELCVAGGAIAGGAIAVGVGDFTHYMIQDLPGDWHQYGVLDGTAHAVTGSFDHTRHDIAHYLDDLNPF